MAQVLNVNLLPQDDMEISSEAGQADIDFDFEYEPHADQSHFQHEEEMQDDTPVAYEQEDIELRSATDNNDYMIDDIAQEPINEPQDGLMVDDMPQNHPDEELLDLSEDDDVAHYAFVDHHLSDVAAQSTAHVSTGDLVHQDWSGSQEAAELETGLTGLKQSSANQHVASAIEDTRVVEDPTKTSQQDHLEGYAGEAKESDVAAKIEESSFANPSLTSKNGDLQHESENLDPTPTVYEHHGNSNDPNGTIPKDPIDLTAEEAIHVEDGTDVATSAQSEHSEEHQTRTGLHPTVVKYDGGQYALFPSSEPADGEEYFLENENLVNGSIGDLLQACRTVLGQTITDDFELELSFEDLGLVISEDSTAAFSASFSELLDLFVRLHRNDGTEHPHAMTVTLASKTRFSNRLILLANSAAAGKGISQIMPNRNGPQNGFENDYEYQEHDGSNYHELVDLEETGERATGAIDTEQPGRDFSAANFDDGTDLYTGEEEEDTAPSQDFLTDHEHFAQNTENDNSHSVSRDEQDAYFQDDASQADQLFDLAGTVDDQDDDEDEINYDDDDEVAVDDAVGAPDNALNSDAGEESDSGAVSPNEKLSQNSKDDAHSDIQSGDNSASPKEKGASRIASGAIASPASKQVVEERDEIDYEDELDDGEATKGTEQIPEVAYNIASRPTTKRSLDDAAGEDDSDTKRNRTS